MYRISEAPLVQHHVPPQVCVGKESTSAFSLSNTVALCWVYSAKAFLVLGTLKLGTVVPTPFQNCSNFSLITIFSLCNMQWLIQRSSLLMMTLVQLLIESFTLEKTSQIIPAHGGRLGSKWSPRSLPTQIFCDQVQPLMYFYRAVPFTIGVSQLFAVRSLLSNHSSSFLRFIWMIAFYPAYGLLPAVWCQPQTCWLCVSLHIITNHQPPHSHFTWQGQGAAFPGVEKQRPVLKAQHEFSGRSWAIMKRGDLNLNRKQQHLI